ncbi:MAG: metallopeptidase family protein [Salinibacterium sp.]|nr:metallopeptidase family protein [Salinibacterium sp.]MBF0673488.1 metallopeptidase family protein [Salinibacterium sp.]
MARTRSTRASKRGGWRDRHGRGMRSSVAGPYLPPLHTRIDVFDMTVASAAGYLRELWPEELAHTRFEVASVPGEASGEAVARWSVFPSQQRIVLYRLPIERMARLHRDDEAHRRMAIESCVFRAVAELLGKDPWDLAPDRFRHF